jgi:hypothetical protein
MQSDGNVVLRDSESKPLWRTGTGGGWIDPRDFIMQTDGNLVLYDTSGQQSWASKTQGNPGAFLNMQNDGNVVVYRAGSTTETGNNALWASRNVPPPLTLKTVVNSGAMLNVGNANLPFLSYYMPFGSDANSGGRVAPYTEQGSWSVPADGGLWCLAPQTVTVNAKIVATWGNGPAKGPSWNWQDLQQAFATALDAVMKAVANPTAYENYSQTAVAAGDTVVCVGDMTFLDWGHYIPQEILITAHNNNTGDEAGRVTVTYSTEGQSGGSACGIIAALGNALQILPETSPLGALVGFSTSLFCSG